MNAQKTSTVVDCKGIYRIKRIEALREIDDFDSGDGSTTDQKVKSYLYSRLELIESMDSCQ